MSLLDNRIPPPLVMLATGLGMSTASLPLAPPSIDWPWRAGAAATAFAAAAIFASPAVRAFRRAGTTIDPVRIERASTLVTSGIFARTRNPMYVSMVLLLLAWAAWLGEWPLATGPVFFVLYVTAFQIAPEERALSARFGDEYVAYRRRTPRWL